MTSRPEPPRRSIRFAGRRWWVKWSHHPVGPGPNVFDDSTGSVDVDADGRLVLRVRRSGDRWVCAEVIGEEVTGYGTYEWAIRTDVSDLQRHVVLGMFTWSDACEQHHRELDIEVSAWGSDGGAIGKFVVQPSESSGHQQRFAIPRTVPWRCSFEWRLGRVTFRAADGEPWRFDRPGVPTPGDVHPRINLWLYQGAAPDVDGTIAVTVERFRYTRALSSG